jgi:hypothetical protein
MQFLLKMVTLSGVKTLMIISVNTAMYAQKEFGARKQNERGQTFRDTVRLLIGNQCRVFNIGSMWFSGEHRVSVKTRASMFWTR